METNYITLTTANETQLKSAVTKGFQFHVEFGNPEADPMPGKAYFCKTIEQARDVYRNHKNEGSLGCVQRWEMGASGHLEMSHIWSGWVK